MSPVLHDYTNLISSSSVLSTRHQSYLPQYVNVYVNVVEEAPLFSFLAELSSTFRGPTVVGWLPSTADLEDTQTGQNWLT